ncbi:hypothetical protein [Rathayibacter iranicus]|uniref:Lipoprotein n=2 Tax=Rathayibacter iranicus TaxID=59737 RepID=A0AAD1A9Z5_9MICO|nr:hypothetical protein [Rathayibacter iranicus]AZZ54471.1 hypothetical protein C7V51_00120 [Rathayibacter iranicus]MWV29890.1 hypothetical protein [Rathayibacter iranicus NCPPB 2253 = VKM Ac-1602]PPI51646.1 hypothetical protein C5E09_00180 [Rathayibacter iranicus]PPI63814.1 hypothetical protein C5E08_00180 [Rathayibacter iranicus]PPI74660.1 hypothetical protein C5E01_00180 [Rathayibacter iranicus]
MLQRPRLRPVVALLVAVGLVLGLSGCMPRPADVPGGSVQESTSSAPAVPVDSATPTDPGTPDINGPDGALITRLIQDCLSRYGLDQRPPPANPLAQEQDQVTAQRLRETYDATLTNCSAEAMAMAKKAPQEGGDASSTETPTG